MLEKKKKGILWKIFGSRKSSCCHVRIEEVTEEEEKAGELTEETKKPSQDTIETKRKPTCCG